MSTMSCGLDKKHCVPCEGGIPALTLAEARRLQLETPAWEILGDGRRICRRWTVGNFLEALEFFRKVGEIAEAEGHHPDLHLEEYKQVRIELWTHAIGGLSENDFIVAARIDRIAPGQ